MQKIITLMTFIISSTILSAADGKFDFATESAFSKKLTKTIIQYDGYDLAAFTNSGTQSPILFLHGFPDNHHLYDRVLPLINPKRKIIALDFLGYGESSKPQDKSYTFRDQVNQLEKVIANNEISLSSKITLVAHDSSVPVAIDFALDHSDQIEKLVLMNGNYGETPSFKKPPAIWAHSTPYVRNVAKFASGSGIFKTFDIVFGLQVGSFFADPQVKDAYFPFFLNQFKSDPSTFEAFYQLNGNLDEYVQLCTEKQSSLQNLNVKTVFLFGSRDPDLQAEIADEVAEFMPTESVRIIKVPNAGHYIQMDVPAIVAKEVQ